MFRSAWVRGTVGVAMGLFLSGVDPSAAQSTNPYARFGGTADANGNPVLPASQIVGATAADIGVGPGGTANYTLPITVPAGTTGVQPNITLQFSSPGGEGVVGFGGSIGGLSFITRCPQDLYYDGVSKPVEYDADDRFCLNGQRLQAVTGTYGANATEYRTYTEEFSKIVSYGAAGSGPAWFRVWRKSGEILDYGATADSRIEALGQASARAWAVNNLQDRQGNYVSYIYFENATTGEFGISTIDYTGNTAQSLTPNNHIEFQYGTRPNTAVAYDHGQAYSQQKRLTGVRVLVGTSQVRLYTITYGVNAQVESIQECASGSSCFPATQFDWVDTESTTPPATPFAAPLTLSTSGIGGATNSTTSHLYWSPATIGDVNGDGITDQLMWRQDGAGKKYGASADEVWLGSLSGAFVHVNAGVAPQGTKILSSGDFNGDGRIDLLVQPVADPASPSAHHIWSGQANGTFAKTAVSALDLPALPPSGSQGFPPSQYPKYSYAEPIWISGDFDGDGRTDLYMSVFIYRQDSALTSGVVASKVERLFRSTGQNSFAYADVDFVLPTTGPGTFDPWSTFSVSDFNGDGLADIFLVRGLAGGFGGNGAGKSYFKSSSDTDRVLLSRGDGTFTIKTLAIADSIPANHTLGVSADFNGDGLGDFHVYPSDYTSRLTSNPNDFLWLSKGDGSFVKAPLAGAAAEATHANWVIAAAGDFDNDGYADIYAYKPDPADGRKMAATSDVIWRGRPNNTFVTVTVPVANSVVTDHIIAGVGDYDGNGTADLYSYQSHTSYTSLSDGTPSDRLYRGIDFRYEQISRITNGLGNTTEFTYTPMTDPSVYTPGTGAVYPAADVTSQADVVSQVRTSNGIGGFNAQDYDYQALREHTSGGGSLGFQKITITDVATGIRAESTYSQDWANKRQGLLLNSKSIAPSGVVLEDQTVTWATALYGAAGPTRRIFHYADTTTTVKKDLNGASLGTVTEDPTYDTYGFPTQVKTTTTDGTLTSIKTTDSVFAHSESSWILGRLSSATATHAQTGKATMSRTSAFAYTTTGLLRVETVQSGDALSYTKTYTHNAFGAVTGVTETWGSTATDGIVPTSRTTTYGYDAQSRFRTSETNPLGHASSTTYDALTGLPTSTTGPNGLTTSFTYDAFGNPLLETRADATTTRVWRFKCSATVICPANGSFVVVTKASGQPLTAVYKDALSRTLQETAVALDGRLIDVKLSYNARGDVTAKSEPTYDGTTPLWTTIQTDILGRPTLTTSPDASTESVTYNGLVNTSTNALSQTKTLTKNVLGQLFSAKDAQNNIVSYEYDAIGQQTAIIEPLGLRTETDYDIRGNKIAVRDPARGNSTLRFNALGLLVESTDAKGQVTRMTYDVLGRMLTRIDDATGSDPASRTSTWTYDTATKGVGKLASSSGYGMSSTPAYDTYGRPVSVTESMGGYSFAFTNAYDASSRVATTTYPSGLVVRSVYGVYGHLSEVENAASGLNYWKLDTIDARGNATQITLGNGVKTYNTYNAQTGALTQILSTSPTVGAPALQNLTYNFDAVGNLTRRTDARQNREETFTYDTLNRVISAATVNTATSTTLATEAYTYDVRGNLKSRTGVGSYTYGTTDGCGAAGPYAVKAIAGAKTASYCYDLNGDMISGDGRTITWSAFGLPTRVVKGLRAIDLSYGPERARFKRIDTNETGVTTTYYAGGGLYEYAVAQSGQITATAYIAGIAHLQTVTAGTSTSTTLSYVLKDHLGSSDVLTDAAGAVLRRYSFDVWGKRRDIDWTQFASGESYVWQSQPLTRGYTFHEQLDSVDLVHMNGRVYDPEIGRFLSADPFVQDVTNTQALNAYTYVNNNPLSFTDPSGFFLKGLFSKIGSFFRSIARAFAHAVRAIVRSSIGRAILQIIACAGPQAAVACAPAAALLTIAAGGSLKQALLSAALSFAQIGQSMGGIIDIWGRVGDFVATLPSALQTAGTMLTHGVVSGALSMAQGGSFESGFLSGAVSAGVGAFAALQGVNDFASRTAISAVVGGTTSVLSGGKFANGAITAAFATMYNEMQHGSPGTQSGMDERAFEARTEGGGLGQPDWDLLAASTPTGECWQAECGLGGWIASAAIGATAGRVPGMRGLATNPFFGKTASEIAEMLQKRGYRAMGPDPLSGRGTFWNPATGRSYHLDLGHSLPKGPHVGVHRLRPYRDKLPARDYPTE